MPKNYIAVDELYNFAIERCLFLMEDSKYQEIISADDDREMILAKGYFQGFYEALQMINDQMNEKLNSNSISFK